MARVDGSGCSLVEVVPGKGSDRPLVNGSRIPADVIVGDFAAGSSPEEIEENYPALSLDTVRALLAYSEREKVRQAS